MFLNAGIAVKGVMLTLTLASILAWTICLAKGWELSREKRQMREQLAALRNAHSLEAVALRTTGTQNLAGQLIHEALDEVRLSVIGADSRWLSERIKLRLELTALAAGREISQGTGVLATIGSTAPFVGLLGTVWGIMSSFISIAASQTTNLAVVAPGIAEALLATALGLMVAIPAVVIYNFFARGIGAFKALAQDLAVQVLLLTHLQLEQQTAKPDSSLADEPEVEDVDNAHIHQAQAEHSWILK